MALDFIRKEHYNTEDLIRIVALLRAPGGCPWDQAQTHASIKKNFIEETYEVIEDVKTFRSEIGILYLNDFNRKVLTKLFDESDLEFCPLMDCGIYVYLWKGHPLANQKEITIEELQEYPCLSFEQGNYNSFYFAEEVLSTYSYKQLIKANARATLLNLMVGLNGYTLCSGILCDNLNGSDYWAVKLKSDEVMTIGYLKRKGIALSPLGQKYLEEIRKFEGM